MLLPAIALAAAPAAGSADWTERMRVAGAQWEECTESAAKSLAKRSKEAADIVAEAAFSVCFTMELELRDLARERGLAEDKIEAAIEQRIGRRRRWLVFIVVMERLPPKP